MHISLHRIKSSNKGVNIHITEAVEAFGPSEYKRGVYRLTLMNKDTNIIKKEHISKAPTKIPTEVAF